MSKIKTVTIESGSSFSDSVLTADRQRNFEICSLVLEGTYTNTSFDLQAKVDGTWFDIYDTFGAKFNVLVVDGKHSLPVDVFKDVTEIRLKGAGNEAAQRTAKFIVTDILG